jgi:hypothetical protein
MHLFDLIEVDDVALGLGKRAAQLSPQLTRDY